MFVGQQYLLLPQVNDTPLHVDPEGGLIGSSCLTHVVGPPLIKSTNSMYPSSQVLQLVDEPSSHTLQLGTLHGVGSNGFSLVQIGRPLTNANV